jgi:hypothetical protein
MNDRKNKHQAFSMIAKKTDFSSYSQKVIKAVNLYQVEAEEIIVRVLVYDT